MIFEVYQDKAKEWRWRLVSIRNKKIVADSGEGYHSKSNVLRAVRRLNQLFSVELKINKL
jgi:uncharacterized protein YegP (UPF0339 family)